MKEHKQASKSKWMQLLRKKWVLPAIYIAIAGFLLSAVIWYQSFSTRWLEGSETNEQTEQTEETNAHHYNEDALDVLQQEETIKIPVGDGVQTEIFTKFFDYNASQEEQEKSLTLYNNRYYQNTGIDIVASTGETFDVVASLTGTVTEVKEDPLLGNVVTISHGDAIETHYASLGEVTVTVGEKVKQGDKIGVAGKNLFNEEAGTHVYFELVKDGVEVNPENYFNEQVSKLDSDHARVSDSDKQVETEKPTEQNSEEENKSEQQEIKDDQEALKEVSFLIRV